MDYVSLLAHYGGGVNKSVRVKEAEALRKKFIYKNERSVPLEKFITNMQTMFTRFSENVEILNDSQKIRLLFQKVQNPILNQIKALLQVSYDMYQSKIVTYDFSSNSLSTEAASTWDQNPQGVVDVNTCGEKAP